MKLRLSGLWFAGSILAVLVVLFSATAALAQDSDNSGALPALLAGGMLMFFLAFAAAIYIYMALALSTIATKTGTENAWLAWIPIANIVLMLNIAKKPIWWIVLCLIPIVSLVVMIIVWMAIAEARKKPNWWGILLIVPVVNFIVPGYLAWSD